MTPDDIRIILYRILSGTLIFSVDGEQYEFRKINNRIRYQSEIIYQNIINDEKYNEWIRLENSEEIMIKLGLWTKETNDLIKKLDKSIENSKVELFQNFLSTDKVKKIRKSLESYKNQMERIVSTKQNFISSHTLEGHAESVKNEFMVCQTLFKNNEKVFANFEDINKSGSYLYFNSLVSEINKYSISITQYKTIARSDEWRSYWNCNKGYIFDGSVAEWTDDQRSLVNITRMYDNIYEHPEAPNNNIINDDDALDGWVIFQKRKGEKQKNQQTVDSLNPNLKNAQEVFLMANNPDDVENILNLNDQDSMSRMKQKIATINSRGTVEDIHMPDVQLELRNQVNNNLKNRK